VQFYADGGTLVVRCRFVSGKASVSTASLTVGSHVITATYGGIAVTAPARARERRPGVNKAGTTTALATSGVRRCMGRV